MTPPVRPPGLLPAAPPPASTEAEPAVRLARVVEIRRQGALIRMDRALWLLTQPTRQAGGELAPGTSLRLQLLPGQEARMLELGGRPLEPPPAVRLRLAPPAPGVLPPPVPGAGADVVEPGAAARADPVRTLASALANQDGAGTVRLPQPDASLAARLLELIRVIGDGGARTIAEALGNELPADQRAAADTALGELRAAAREPLPGGWRLLLLPFGLPGEVQDLRVHLRADPDGGRGKRASADDAEASSRAVFDLDLSHLGRCQLDALCRGRRFDLILRTRRPLGARLEREVGALFAAARDAAGLSGELGFRPREILDLPSPRSARARSITA